MSGISKNRYIDTKFWNDNFISELDPIEKLLFIYCLTNEHTNICGIYELPLKIMSVETGIEVSMIKKIFPRLRSRIGYIGGMIVIKKFVKHQETGSELIKKGIVNRLEVLDKDFLKNLVNKGFYELPNDYLDTLYIPYAKGSNYSNSNSNSNNTEASSVVAKPFNWKEYHLQMSKDKRKHVRIIAYYLLKINKPFSSNAEVEEAIARHSKYAVKVGKFEREKIIEVMDKCHDQYTNVEESKKIEWTLETVWKHLTK